MPVQSDHLLYAIPLDDTLFVEIDMLGIELSTTIADRTAFVRFPVMPPDPPDDRIVLQAPTGTPDALANHVDLWGMARDADSGAELHALIIAVEARGTIDWELEEFPAAGEGISKISTAVHSWCSRFMHWIFCLTAQSLDVQNPDPKTIHRNSTT